MKLCNTSWFLLCRKQNKRNETPLNGAAGGQEESVYEELDELQIMNSIYLLISIVRLLGSLSERV